MLLVPQDGVLVLEAAAQAGGRTYRLLAQESPTPDPLFGIALGEREALLYLDGAPAPLPGGPIVQGQSVRIVLNASRLRTRVGQGRYWIALVVRDDGGAWAVAASWEVEVDYRTFPVYVYAIRLADGSGVVVALTPLEAPERAELRLGEIHLVQSWGGYRRGEDGSPAFAFTLPPQAVGEGEVVIYRGGRWGRGRFSLGTWSPAGRRAPTWRLPPWLPPDRPPQAFLLEATARVLPNGEEAANQVSPDRAAGQHLRTHAHLFAAPPDREEEGVEEAALRKRLGAIPRGEYASIPALRSAFARLAQGIIISDRFALAGRPLKLDSTWRLDGAQVLGGDPGASIPTGYYLVRIYDVPFSWRYYWRELQRLRPAGFVPIVTYEASRAGLKLGLGAGAREIGLEVGTRVELAQRRYLDRSWRLDGSARIAGGAVVRGEVHTYAP